VDRMQSHCIAVNLSVVQVDHRWSWISSGP